MNSSWKTRLLAAANRKTETDEAMFLRAVDEVAGKCNLDVARILMKTFSDRPDYGTQERVISVLATARDEDVTVALLKELPRLLAEAPEWAETLIGGEVDHRPDLLASTASRMPSHIKDALAHLLSNDSFREFYPQADKIKL